jgi:hypothetical protein
VVELVFSLFWWIILFPVVWLVSVPFVLVVALFRREPYRVAVFECFLAIHRFWVEWGAMFV